MNKWHLIFSGILHLLLHYQVLGDESCGKILAMHMLESNAETGNFEAFMRSMESRRYFQEYAGKSCDVFAYWINYLMHQTNIGEVKNVSQLIKDIDNFPSSIIPDFNQTRDELSHVLNVDFLQETEDEAPRTAVCRFQPFFFDEASVLYTFPGGGHIFVLEKGGKDEFRFWQSWIHHFSALEWLQGKIKGEATSRDTTYTGGKQPLSRQKAKQLVNDLIMFSDSKLDWNRREQLSAKLFWSDPNLFLRNQSDFRFFDSNGNVSIVPSCDKEYKDARARFFKDVEDYLLDPEILKAAEERKKLDNCGVDFSMPEWFLECDRNVYSTPYYLSSVKWRNCYRDFSKTIDLSNVPNLPKVRISMICKVTPNSNNGEQCVQNIRDINRIITENP